MTYTLNWHIPNKVLLLTLSGDYTVADAQEVDQAILTELRRHTALTLLIDAQDMERPYNFRHIRNSQTYMKNAELHHICAVTDDRLIQLSLMVIFDLGRATFHVFDKIEKTSPIIQQWIGNVS